MMNDLRKRAAPAGVFAVVEVSMTRFIKREAEKFNIVTIRKPDGVVGIEQRDREGEIIEESGNRFILASQPLYWHETASILFL
jgi:hypothetical protein